MVTYITLAEPIEPSAPGDHPDEDDFSTSACDAQSLASSSTSLNSSVYQHAYENGRRVSWDPSRK